MDNKVMIDESKKLLQENRGQSQAGKLLHLGSQ